MTAEAGYLRPSEEHCPEPQEHPSHGWYSDNGPHQHRWCDGTSTLRAQQQAALQIQARPRVTDTDRQKYIDRLTGAFESGAINLDVMNARIEVALKATDQISLDVLLQDLPGISVVHAKGPGGVIPLEHRKPVKIAMPVEPHRTHDGGWFVPVLLLVCGVSMIVFSLLNIVAPLTYLLGLIVWVMITKLLFLPGFRGRNTKR